MLWSSGDVKEHTRLSQRVGHVVPGVVVWPSLLKWGLGWEMLGDISYIKVLYNPRVNIVFTYSHSHLVSYNSGSNISFPEAAILLVSDRDRDLWPGPTPQVRDSRPSRQSAHAQNQVWQTWLVLVSIYCVYLSNRKRFPCLHSLI